MTQENKKRPGDAALQNMEKLNNDSSVFKVPKVPPLRKKARPRPRVLDEEDYVQGIAQIIQRDFFPDLEKLKAQNDYLEASENKDYAKLRELARKYSGQTPPTEPYNSPATFDTPKTHRPDSPSNSLRYIPLPGETPEMARAIVNKYTLDSFLAQHTSEDNSSYERIIAHEKNKRSRKLAHHWKSELTAARQADSALALPSFEQQARETRRQVELNTWRYRSKNFIMYVPEGALSQVPGRKPELHHQNTRLRKQVFNTERNKEAISAMARSQELAIHGKIGVDGCNISDRPEYKFVTTPSPRPGAGPDQSPLMTWGEIEGTPFRLDGGNTPLPAIGAGAAYRMLETGARERIAQQLAERASKRRRSSTPKHSSRSPSSRSYRTSTERYASMSPAARKLAAKHLMSPRLKLTSNDMGISQRVKTTPTTETLVSTPMTSSPGLTNNTVSPAPTNVSSATDNKNITDNLLNINVGMRTRLRASDFF